MDINRYIQHSELLNRDTLYELRSYVALYPYHQAARLLMLKNMYLLHDPSFGEELRQAAYYITDRSVLFEMIEGQHYKLTPRTERSHDVSEDRTDTLITNYLDSIPSEEDDEKKSEGRRRPTAVDATIDYMSYLMEAEEFEANENSPLDQSEQIPTADVNKDEHHRASIIDNFLENGKIVLQEDSDYTPHTEVELENDKDEVEEGYFTETLAKIYIKQGNYSKAFEIIQRLNLIFPKKSAYFADQMRYLEKIILIKQ